MKKVLLMLLLLVAMTDVTRAQAATSADQKATRLERELPFVKEGPKILKVPMSYRLVPICNKDTGKTLKEISLYNDRRQTVAVALTKPEQMPPAIRAIAKCPQCEQEKKLRVFISLEVSDWLRRLPESRQEKIAEACAK